GGVRQADGDLRRLLARDRIAPRVGAEQLEAEGHAVAVLLDDVDDDVLEQRPLALPGEGRLVGLVSVGVLRHRAGLVEHQHDVRAGLRGGGGGESDEEGEREGEPAHGEDLRNSWKYLTTPRRPNKRPCTTLLLR